jgi:glycine/D-amino acid oxidase-like deaminating enzyme/nitrite reductase/ring-hydroxylating ferredoxin subunit
MKTNTYWVDTTEIERFHPLDKNVSVDVIVVGAGLTGITAAYLAKRAGKTVALVDRERCGGIDSSLTTAHLTAVTDLRLQEIVRNFSKDAACATWDAGIAAINQIVRNIRRQDIACDFHWVPGYLHAPLRDANPSYIEELEKEAAIAAELEIGAKYMEAIPFFDVPGLRFDHQALFNPRKYLRPLVKSLPGGGSYVFEETNADEIVTDPLILKSHGHEIRGKYLIVATHNPISGIAGAFSSMLFQTKLSLYTSYVVGGKIPKGLLPAASFWDNADPYDYLRVDPQEQWDYVIFGGEDHKTGQQEDTQIPYQKLEARLKSFLPQIEIDHRWSGQVIETNDGLPFIGEITAGQFIATGFAGNGMTFGTLGAMMAVDALLKRPNPWQDLFSPDRSKILGGLWSYLKENKDYPYHLVRDWMAVGEDTPLDDVKRGEGKVIKLGGKKVAAYRDENNRLSVCSAVCTHLKCIVDWNTAEKTWDCPCHGSRFHPTGEVISGPAEEPLEKITLK